MDYEPGFREEFRFGSAAWATKNEIAQAGMLNRCGPQVGFFEGLPLHLDSDAPMITVAGAGAGKCTSVLSFLLCQLHVERFFVLDLRGELGAISIHNFAAKGINAHFWNPCSLAGLPHDKCNPLDVLRRDSGRLHADAKMIAESLIPFTEGGSGRYFEQRARDWLDTFLVYLVDRYGFVDFPMLSVLVNSVEGNTDAWLDEAEIMSISPFPSVRRTVGEMIAKQKEAPKEFGGILGTIYGCLSFLDDPALLASLDNADFSLAALCDEARPSTFFLNVPHEYVGVWSPLLRCFFTSAMLYKSRKPEAPRITMLIDEAGQLGNFTALLKAYTFGRGAGIRTWAFFQDLSQIQRNYGTTALQSFLGSAQFRQFFGIRDIQTAEIVSKMLGVETLEYVNPLQRERAKHGKMQALLEILTGNNPLASAREYKRLRWEIEHREKQTRQLLTPDEVLVMAEQKQIIFISGLNLRPIFAEKYPYYLRPEMAGKFLPNPYHPPCDSVVVQTDQGPQRRCVITEPVPPELAHYPQYRNGSWSYVDGYRPSLGRNLNNDDLRF
ncbi:type IV secretory system conjugative DNA transfer family protein [Aquisediminimonas profunda]|uniref:type IV secretory system conjugative DNA transfer family protein n=1 Tax=Aquisediminimonas profunda TaxID=1550733 RepID=UPI001C6284B9|nr:type IV secretory system conjugative DNA transfer family protein [Aquisediminimonas profunda]